MAAPENPRSAVRPFDHDFPMKKVRLAEDAWNSRDPQMKTVSWPDGWRALNICRFGSRIADMAKEQTPRPNDYSQVWNQQSCFLLRI
jgi:nuclear transport factor 2 (NTF2) superfamily protein